MNPVQLSRFQSRKIDQLAIEDLGIPGVALMENAGRNCAERVLCLLNHGARKSAVVIACGIGNNGGDGFVIARHLHNHAVPVKILILGDPGILRGDALVNYDIAQKMDLPTLVVDGGLDIQSDPELITHLEGQPASLFVDAILGTGAKGDPRPPADEVIRIANAMNWIRIAIDVPTGLDCETGVAATPTIRADRTLTMVAPKIGYSNASAKEYLGSTEVIDIGIPRELIHRVVADSNS